MPAVAPDFRLLSEISAESAQRPLRHQQLEVLTYQPASERPEEQLALPGTITVLVARKGNTLMREIQESIAAKDGREAELAKRLYGQFAGKKSLPLAEAAALARRQTVLADLRYGGKEIVSNLFVPRDEDVALISLPYNGGSLARGGFTLAEHLETSDAESLDVLVLRHSPPLTRAERAALNKVPAAQREINVGRGPGDVACSVLILTAAVVVEAAFVAVTFAVTGGVDLEHATHLDLEEIVRLGPEQTAQQLTEIRRQLLLGKAPGRAL